MTIIRSLLDALLGVERIIVKETERMLVLADGRFKSVLGPGEHAINARNRVIETHGYDVTDAVSGDLIETLRGEGAS